MCPSYLCRVRVTSPSSQSHLKFSRVRLVSWLGPVESESHELTSHFESLVCKLESRCMFESVFLRFRFYHFCLTRFGLELMIFFWTSSQLSIQFWNCRLLYWQEFLKSVEIVFCVYLRWALSLTSETSLLYCVSSHQSYRIGLIFIDQIPFLDSSLLYSTYTW